MRLPYPVALQGFSPFERNALSSYFRLSLSSSPSYHEVTAMDEAYFLIADAEHPGVVQQILRAGREGDTMFVGAQAPDGAMAWMMRPIDPAHMFRVLDAVVARRDPDMAYLAESPPATPAAVSHDDDRPQRRASDSRPGDLGPPELPTFPRR
jgi:hypothetical protein